VKEKIQKIKGYYFITDSSLTRRGIFEDVKLALSCGVSVFQYREKNKSSFQMHTEAVKLKKLCRNVLFLINDRIDIALSSGADGVHLGQDDMPLKIARKILKKKIIGVTVHNVKEAIEAEKNGADYLGLSPIFQTSTKKDAGKPCGVEMIKKVKGSVRIPVVAIGGITPENAPQVVDAGADALCAISAVLCAEEPRNAIKRLQQIFEKKKNP